MSSTSIHHRPVPFYAAAAAAVAVGALAVGSVALAVSHDAGHPGAPGGQPRTSVQQSPPRAHHFHPTTSGGRVMLGE